MAAPHKTPPSKADEAELKPASGVPWSQAERIAASNIDHATTNEYEEDDSPI
jgi:hypothetical protein